MERLRGFKSAPPLESLAWGLWAHGVSGFRVSGLEFISLGFRVWGFGFEFFQRF